MVTRSPCGIRRGCVFYRHIGPYACLDLCGVQQQQQLSVSAAQLGKAGQAMAIGTPVFVFGYGAGTVAGFERHTFSANRHTIQFETGGQSSRLHPLNSYVELCWSCFGAVLDQTQWNRGGI
jgi:hypothetical protein